MQPYRPILGSTDFIAFQVEKLIGRHIIGKNIISRRLQNRRENDTVKNNIVFTDEMQKIFEMEFKECKSSQFFVLWVRQTAADIPCVSETWN